jgi:hypothetical protein
MGLCSLTGNFDVPDVTRLPVYMCACVSVHVCVYTALCVGPLLRCLSVCSLFQRSDTLSAYFELFA